MAAQLPSTALQPSGLQVLTRPLWASRSPQDQEDSGDMGARAGQDATPVQTVDVGTLHEAAACISPALGPGPSTTSSRLCGCMRPLGPPDGSPPLHRRAWAHARRSRVLPAQGRRGGPFTVAPQSDGVGQACHHPRSPQRSTEPYPEHQSLVSAPGGDGDRRARPQGGVLLPFYVCRGI